MITSSGQATRLRLPAPFPSPPPHSTGVAGGGDSSASSSSLPSSSCNDLSYSSLERSLPFSFSCLSVLPPTSFSLSPCRSYLLILQPFRLLIFSNHQYRVLLASFTRPPNTFHFGCHVYATWQFQALSRTPGTAAVSSTSQGGGREGGERGGGGLDYKVRRVRRLR